MFFWFKTLHCITSQLLNLIKPSQQGSIFISPCPPPPKKCHYPFKPNQWNVQPSFPHKARARVHVWESNNLFSFLSVQPSHPFSPSLWHKRQHLCIENNLRDVSWTPNAGKKKKNKLSHHSAPLGTKHQEAEQRRKTWNISHFQDFKLLIQCASLSVCMILWNDWSGF